MIPLEEIEHGGFRVHDEICEFLMEAEEANYRTVDGCENLDSAFEILSDMATRTPSKIKEAWGSNDLLRCACYALTANCTWQSSLDKADVKAAISASLKKADIVEAMAYYGSCVNEYYRLRWIVEMQGGWCKPKPLED